MIILCTIWNTTYKYIRNMNQYQTELNFNIVLFNTNDYYYLAKE